jgi:2',3'-cyclic-nucleotide 2'-phosphodiesterase (5'-nucleotidase family)
MKNEKSPKKQKSNIIHLTQAEVDILHKKTTSDLLKDYLNGQKAIRDISKRKKQDSELNLLKEEIKKHRDEFPDEKMQKEIKKMKERAKEIKAEVDAEIPDQLTDLKQRNKDYRDDMAPVKEKIKLVQKIVDSRGDK